jgi:hypothetical protein
LDTLALERRSAIVRIVIVGCMLAGLFWHQTWAIANALGPNDIVPANRSFEVAGYEVGNPTNHDFESAGYSVGTPPENSAFTNGPTGWSVSGTVSTVSGVGPYASYASLGNGGGGSGTAVSSAFTVDSNAQVMSIDYMLAGTGGTNTLFVEVMSGATYSQSSTVANISCACTTGWTRRDFDVSQWRGHSIKIKVTGYRLVRITHVGTARIELADWTVNQGVVERVSGFATGFVASLKAGNTTITSAPYVLGASAQSLSVPLKFAASNASGNWAKIFVIPSGSNPVEVHSLVCTANACVLDWQSISINISSWAGQTIQLRLWRWSGSDGALYVDNVGVSSVQLHGWHVSEGLATAASGGTNGDRYASLYSGNTTIVSSAFYLPMYASQFTMQIKFFTSHATATNWLRVYALSGPNFGISTQVAERMCTCALEWETLNANMSGFGGQTIKLKFVRWSGSPGAIGIDDVAGSLVRTRSVEYIHNEITLQPGGGILTWNVRYRGNESWYQTGAGSNVFTHHEHTASINPSNVPQATSHYMRMVFRHGGVEQFVVPNNSWDPYCFFVSPDWKLLGGCSDSNTFSTSYSQSAVAEVEAQYGWAMCDQLGCWATINREYPWQVWP